MITWFTRLLRRSQPDHLDCAAVGLVLQQYLDNEVDPERRRLIAEHLDDCRRCGLEADAYIQIKASIAQHRADVPDEAVERLREFGYALIRGNEACPT